ncbi:glutaminyl-peptide cyclotransferase-like protein [Coregonus clupeaformis]|uniref:glutaminyl-peptide cyclotransferase-like protein n=1 Tax=Coregonus clupeaformis TaxID=59861 RepID=UPI001E1C5B26|nr:glutaminyl-peptide cyclotransferase-like protein [Coregonus clupeaformis]
MVSLRASLSRKTSKSSPSQVRLLASQVDGTRLWETHLRPILSQAVRQATFSNIITTLDPGTPRRLLLTYHYDSKVLPPDTRVPERVFLGASDSAVPCAMILELASALDTQLKALNQRVPSSTVTLQRVFFDGEESFEEWTATDSLRINAPGRAHDTHTNLLQAVDLFVLLDLLGGPDPLIVNHFDNTARWFDCLQKRLHRQGLLTSHPSEQTYFRKDVYLGPVQEDHIPFLHKGVPVFHDIATPFPLFWHTLDGTEENLTKVLAVFLAEYLGF